MLDAIGGSAGFRTRIQTNPDGSTTILRTKNGMPQFTTTPTQRGELAERAYDERLWTLPIAPGVYIPGLSYTQRFTLTNTATLTVGTYPTTDTNTTDWAFTDITSLEGLTFADAVRTSKVTYNLSGDVVCSVSPTIITYSSPYTVVGDFTTGWTSARLNRARFIKLIGGPNQRVLLKTPNQRLDASGISPFDTVTLFGKPWHGELKATGLQCTPEILRTECVVSASTTRPDCSYVRFDATEQITTPTEAEAAYGVSWRNYALLVGAEKLWRGGTSDSATVGGSGWLYRDEAGRVWQFSFSHNIPSNFGTTTVYRCPYASTTFTPTNHTVTVSRKRFGTSDTPVVVDTITVPIGARLYPSTSELPLPSGGSMATAVLCGIAGGDGQNMVMQAPDGAAAVLNIRSVIDAGDTTVCAAVVEAVVTDAGDDPPTVELSIVSSFADQRTDTTDATYGVVPQYRVVIHETIEGSYPNAIYKLWAAVEEDIYVHYGFPATYEVTTQILVYHTYTKAGERIPVHLKLHYGSSPTLPIGWESAVYTKNFHKVIPYEEVARYDSYDIGSDMYRTSSVVFGASETVVFSYYDISVRRYYLSLHLGGGSPGASIYGSITLFRTDNESISATSGTSGYIRVRSVSNCVVAAYLADGSPNMYTLKHAVSQYGVFAGSVDFGETATPLAVCVNPYDGAFQINTNNSWRGFV